MNPAYIFGGLVLGLAAGVLSGIIGIGGGILLIPALVYMFGMSQLKAQGTSLAVLLLPVGILAVLPYYRDGQIDIKLAALIALGFALGGWAGGNWAQHIPAIVLRRGFAALLVIVAAKLFFTK
jgi:uncharacterized membrane protein YfcA